MPTFRTGSLDTPFLIATGAGMACAASRFGLAISVPLTAPRPAQAWRPGPAPCLLRRKTFAQTPLPGRSVLRWRAKGRPTLCRARCCAAGERSGRSWKAPGCRAACVRACAHAVLRSAMQCSAMQCSAVPHCLLALDGRGGRSTMVRKPSHWWCRPAHPLQVRSVKSCAVRPCTPTPPPPTPPPP